MNHTKRITFAAMIAAIYIILLYLDKFSGLGIIFIILPLPIAIYTFIFGFKSGVILYISLFILSVPVDLISAIYFSITSNIIGLVYSVYLRKKNYKELYLILISFLVVFFTNIIAITQIGSFFGFSYSEEIDSYFEIVNGIIKLFNINSNDGLTRRIVSEILISLYMIFSIIEAYVIHLIIFLVMHRLKLITAVPSSVFKLKFPKHLAIVAIIINILFLFLIADISSDNDLKFALAIIFLNLFIITNFIYSFLTISCYGKLTLSRNLKILYILGSLFLFIIFPITGFVGILINISDLDQKIWYNN